MSPSASRSQVYSVAKLCSDQNLFLCHRRHVAWLFMLYKINQTRITVCAVSFLLLLPESNIPELWPGMSNSILQLQTQSEFVVSGCRTSLFTRCFLPALVRMWNDLPCTAHVFDTRTLDGLLRVQSIVSCFPELCFLQLSVAQVVVGLRKQFINNFIFPTWARAAGFNNNNNNNNNNPIEI